MTLTQTFEDAGISGTSTDNRPAFKSAMRAVLQPGTGSTLIVYKLDRLGRNALDVQETLAVLLDAGVRVVSLADGLDSASGMGSALLKLLTGILATFAELDRENIRIRLSESRKRADTENRTYASEPRYGRRVADDNKTLHAEPAEVALVERVRELRATGRSFQAICDRLELEGHRPRRALAVIGLAMRASGSRRCQVGELLRRGPLQRLDDLEGERRAGGERLVLVLDVVGVGEKGLVKIIQRKTSWITSHRSSPWRGRSRS